MSRSVPTGFSMRGGYLQRYLPNHPMAMADGYVSEPRFVMSEYLGRPLKASEHVHHKDEDKSNNDINNLEISSLRKHVKEHWAARETSCKYCGSATKSLIVTCKRCWDFWYYHHRVDSRKHDKEICLFCD